MWVQKVSSSYNSMFGIYMVFKFFICSRSELQSAHLRPWACPPSFRWYPRVRFSPIAPMLSTHIAGYLRNFYVFLSFYIICEKTARNLPPLTTEALPQHEDSDCISLPYGAGFFSPLLLGHSSTPDPSRRGVYRCSLSRLSPMTLRASVPDRPPAGARPPPNAPPCILDRDSNVCRRAAMAALTSRCSSA